MLIQGLPPGGHVYRTVQGHGWVDTDYLIADLIDDTRQGVTATYRTNSRKRVPDPRRYQRPGEDDNRKRVGNRAGQSTESVVAYLDSLMPSTSGTSDRKGA